MKYSNYSIYNFEDLLQGNFLYVDKTEYIWQLIKPSQAMYFLSRPRRFGKSLTISTLKAVFEGKKELFKGLAIYDKPYDWKPYPIIHLSFGDYNPVNNTSDKLNAYLQGKIMAIAQNLSVNLQRPTDPSDAFGKLIDKLSAKERVVILVDEYDKPILDNITNPSIKEIQKCLKGFYGILKDRNHQERFLFVTGVSKFSHVSLFSDLNNLTDITMDARYATMFGYTQKEFEANFKEQIELAEKKQSLPHAEFLQKIKAWYDGFRFEENSESVYNPVSVAKFFEQGGKFNNYWFATGTPAFLLDLIKQKRFDFETALNEPASEIAFSAYEVDNLEVLPLLLQAGYLTIKDSFQQFDMTYYNLCFPNIEVKSAFDKYLLNTYTDIDKETLSKMVSSLARSVQNGDVDGFMESLKAFLAAIPYDIQLKDEKYYQTIFYTLFLLLGVYIEAEARTNKGRIDAVAACGNWVYIFEFKLNQNAKAAMNQIRQKEYYQKYSQSGKNIILIGANFDFAQRQITDWTQEDYPI